MTLLTYPMQDNFETKLSQARNGATGTVYVQTAPSFTMPASSFTVVTVDPWTDKEQAFIMDSFNTSAKTLNCYSISVDKWPSLAYTQQSHSVGAKVIISNNYRNWKKVKDELDWKAWLADTNTWSGTQTFSGAVVNTLSWKPPEYADATARDAAIPSPSNGMLIYNTAVWLNQKYLAGIWTDDTAWGAVPNFSTSVAGKWQGSVSADILAGTLVGSTGANLIVTPDLLKSIILDKSLRLPMTAGENLTAGDLVYADADWTARKTVRKASAAAQVSTATSIDVPTNATHQIRCEYLTTDKAIIIYTKTDNIAYWRVVTFSRSTPTRGSEQAISSAMNADSWPDLAVLSSGLFVVTYKKNADSKAYAVACTVSWTTITAGTEVKMYDTEAVYANVSPFCAKVTATSFVVTLQNFTSNDPIAIAGTISGTTITAWSSAQLKATTMNGAGHVLCTYVSDWVVGVWYDNGTNIFVNTLTISGTTITVKTELDTSIAWYCSGSDQILYLSGWTFALFKNNIASTTRILTYNVADQSSRTVPVFMQSYYLPNDFTNLFNYWYANYLGNGIVAYVNQTVTSADMRFRLFHFWYYGSLMPFYDTTITWTVWEVCMAKLTTNQDKVLMLYRDTGTTNLNYSLYRNTENQFVWVVATTTSAAWTAPINNTGTTTISWLTAWQVYYVWDAGAVATSGTKQIGVALTTSSLLLS